MEQKLADGKARSLVLVPVDPDVSMTQKLSVEMPRGVTNSEVEADKADADKAKAEVVPDQGTVDTRSALGL